MVSVLVPISYVLFILGSLSLFSRRYRAKTAASKQSWFPRHEERDLYVSLLSHLTKDDPNAPTPAHPYLTGALMRRAMTDMKRMNELQKAKQALTVLLQRGQIGDDLWNQLLAAEKEMEAELMEVVSEANTYKMGWGQSILGHAADMVQHESYKKIFEGIESDRQTLEQQRRIQSTNASNKLLGPAPILSLAAFQPLGELPPKAPSPAPRPLSRTPSSQQVPGVLQPAKAAQQATADSAPSGVVKAAPDAAVKAPAQNNGSASIAAESSEDEGTNPKPANGAANTGPSKKKKKKNKKK